MPHRIVVLGAGYAGMPAVKRLARRLHPDDVDIVLVSQSDRFVERPRLHQIATGQQLQDIPLRRHLRGTGIRLTVGRVTHLDRSQRCVTLTGPDGDRRLEYDTLIYALGSTTDTESVPGVARHAHTFDGPQSAERLHAALRQMISRGGTVVVCGGGLTGIETAAEIAKSFPTLQVRLVTAGSPGGWLSSKGRSYITDALERFGVSITGDVRIAEVASDRLILADGSDIPFDVCVWAGGFTVPALARDSGLEVDETGRILTDRHLRALSDSDIWALGDAAAVPGPWGDALAMGCRTGGFTAPAGADNVAAALTGGRLRPFSYRYFHECISLGRRRGLVQFLHKDESPTKVVLTGRLALRYKEATLRAVVMLLRWPGPYLPFRRRHAPPSPAVAADPGRPGLGDSQLSVAGHPLRGTSPVLADVGAEPTAAVQPLDPGLRRRDRRNARGTAPSGPGSDASSGRTRQPAVSRCPAGPSVVPDDAAGQFLAGDGRSHHLRGGRTR